ncbi:MAG: D-glycero-alpha-D-manno-heptose-1,7-bisphosphate 7-phosphatase [Longimicrobiaceae bacterium]
MTSSSAAARAAVFLDRDGTLIHDRHYLSDPAGVELLPGAAEAVARLNRAGLFVVLVTNQSGIGRGLYGEDEYRAVHARLVELLAAEGARLDADYHCTLAPDAPDPGAMRKPGAGMFLRAAREHGLDPAAAWYVGDRARDVAPAEALGGRGILVRGAQTEPDAARSPGVAAVVDSLAEAVDLILSNRPAGGGEED